MASTESRLSGTISASAIGMLEAPFEEGDELQDAGRIDQAGLEQRLGVGELARSSRNRKLSVDEGADLWSTVVMHECSSRFRRRPRVRFWLRATARLHEGCDARAGSRGCRRRPRCRGSRRRRGCAHFCAQLLDRPRIEDTRGRRSRRATDGRLDIGRRVRRRRRTGCPARDRAASAVADRRRQQVRACFAQDVLLAQPAHLQPRRNAGGEFDDAVVEEREAALDRVRHRHAVALRREDVARQQIARSRDTAPATADASARTRPAGCRAARRARRSRRAAARRSPEKNDLGAGRGAEARQMREQRIARRRRCRRGRTPRDSFCDWPLQARQIRIEPLQQQRPPREPGCRAQKRRSFASLKMS